MGSVRSGRVIDAALRKKGFRRELVGKHIHYFFNGNSQIVTHMSHGMMGSTLSAKLIADMSHQLHLTKSQFLDLIDCSLDEAGYREILKGQGLVV